MLLSPPFPWGPPAPVERNLHGITLDDLIKVNVGRFTRAVDLSAGLVDASVVTACLCVWSLSDSDDTPPRPALGRNASLRDLRKDEKKLGKGSFGEVLCVRISTDPSGRLYALKSLRKRDVEQGQLSGQVEREISVQSRLPAHPNILRLYSHFEDREYVYLLLEYCAKGRTMLPSSRVEDYHRYFLMAAQAVGHLHSHGIIHRDIKPENLLITADDTLKLADFGWCAELPPPVSGHAGHARRYTFCGTLDYLSPEMLLGRGHNHSIDLWGLGVLLYELLAGRPPFNATDQRTVVNNIINVKLTFPADFPLVAEDLVRRLLVRDEGRRCTIGEVLAHPLCTSIGSAQPALPRRPVAQQPCSPAALPAAVVKKAPSQQRDRGNSHPGLVRVPTLRTLEQPAQAQQPPARELPHYLHRSLIQCPKAPPSLEPPSQVSMVVASPSVQYRPLPSGNLSVCYPPQRGVSAVKPPSSGTPVTVRVSGRHLPQPEPVGALAPTLGFQSLHESFAGSICRPPVYHRRLQSPLPGFRDVDQSSLVLDASSFLSLDDSFVATTDTLGSQTSAQPPPRFVAVPAASVAVVAPQQRPWGTAPSVAPAGSWGTAPTLLPHPSLGPCGLSFERIPTPAFLNRVGPPLRTAQIGPTVGGNGGRTMVLYLTTTINVLIAFQVSWACYLQPRWRNLRSQMLDRFPSLQPDMDEKD
ncbi:hypothetical protein FOZ61_007625 [Perkinsus olseni]|uniref:Aurora kinase n=1 Tax=Perkinsus olseni TaxID=32597 RepID=A0A7J6L851_PEROL|nr:hypothetical protein FOZ61_007625 [Perkinsus olseni]